MGLDNSKKHTADCKMESGRSVKYKIIFFSPQSGLVWNRTLWCASKISGWRSCRSYASDNVSRPNHSASYWYWQHHITSILASFLRLPVRFIISFKIRLIPFKARLCLVYCSSPCCVFIFRFLSFLIDLIGWLPYRVSCSCFVYQSTL